MRISDWSSDVCSSDLRSRDTVIGRKGKVRPDSEIGFVYCRFRIAQLGLMIAVLGYGCRAEQRRVEHRCDLVRIDDRFVEVFEDEYGKQPDRSEETTSELQSLMRTSYAVVCLKKKKTYASTTDCEK